MKHSRNRFKFQTEADRSFSFGTLYTPIGEFYEVIMLSDEDRDIANDWDAYEFVRYKCQLSYNKKKLRLAKEKLTGMRYLLNQTYEGLLQKYKSDGLIPDDSYAVIKRMRQQVVAMDRDVKHFSEQVSNMDRNFPQYVEATLNKRKEIRQKAAEASNK